MLERSERRSAQGRARTGRPAVLLFALFGVLLARLADSAAAQEVRYLYGAKGQLIGVIDTDGSVATYSWDESGNLLGIARTDVTNISGQVGITLVSPNQGKPGDPVEIFGKGLASPSALTFYNGVAATVQTSTSTYIKTTVPTGAATGLIHVVTSLG